MTNNTNTVSLSTLIKKELKLAIHPTTFIFLCLSLMMLIPDYPLYVTFFYMGLGIFFICLTGRENQDIFFSLMLPIKKADIVKARFALVILIEIAQLLIAVLAAIFRALVMKIPNHAGMDANIAFFGLTLILIGIYNYFFLTNYYKATEKVGKTFLITSTIVFLYIFAAEACTFAIPFFHDVLDTPDPQNLLPKLAVLAIGVIVYIVLTFLSERKSIKLFEKADF